jgi:iron complex outermembrane receptor protein
VAIKFHARWLSCAGLLPFLLMSGQASAQDTPPATPAATGALDTVIVTARKVSEDAQTVPISITDLSQADLDRLNVVTIDDLQTVAPSLTIEPSTFRQDTLDITIRGQRNYDSASGGGNPSLDFDPATAIYQDGVYYARSVGLTGQLFDLDNVDILKGPQGTLVGRNSTGGAILFESRQPTDEFGGYVKLRGGDYDQYGAQGAINIPLSDNLFFRAAISSMGQKGYIANYFTDPASGYTNNQAGMGTQKLAGRFSLKWIPDDSFSLLLRADLSEEHDTGTTYHDLGYFVGTTLATGSKPSICNIPAACSGFTDLLGHPIASYYTTVTASGVSGINTAPATYNSLLNSVAREQAEGFWSTEQAVSNLDVGHYQTVSATADKQFDDIDVKLIGAYHWFDSTGQAISRGLPYVANIYLYQIPRYQSWQSELTVNGKYFDDRLKWTAGLFFFEESDPNDGGYQYLFLPSAGSPPSAVNGKQITVTDSSRNGELNISYAGYAQATYSIWPDTRVTAGVRYTVDQRDAFLGTQTVRTPATTATNAGVVGGTFNAAVYSVDGITYAGQTDVCALTNASGSPLPLGQCSYAVSQTFHKPTWTLAIDHDLFDKTMVYFTSRSGYRSGAINTGALNPVVTVAQPEEVIDYEVGVKSDWSILGMPVRTNVDGYQTAYHDLQVPLTLPNNTIATGPNGTACTQAVFNAAQCTGTYNSNLTLNAARARAYGVEWDITLIPIPALTLNASGSYLDARYTDFSFSVPAGYLLPASGPTNLSGTPIPSPRWQLNETATYSFGSANIDDFSIGDMRFTAHYYWQGRYLADLAGFNSAQQTSSYGMLNLQFMFADFGKSGADLVLFMNNATDQKACAPEYNGVLNSAPNATFGTAGTSGVLQCVPLPPRMSGMSLQYSF